MEAKDSIFEVCRDVGLPYGKINVRVIRKERDYTDRSRN